MDESFIRDRITELRLQKGLSEYRLSFELGHSKGYVQSISSGRALPSMTEFLYICEYFGITPRDFFDTENRHPQLLSKLFSCAAELDEADQRLLLTLAERLKKGETL